MATAVAAQPNEAEKILSDVGSFFTKLVTDLKKAKQIFDSLSPEVKAVFVPIFQQAVAEAKNVSGAVAAEGLNVTLDVATGEALVSLVQQAIAGEKAIVADFKALGITF